MVKTISKLKKEAWRLFSLKVRLKNADDFGFNVCVTCRNRYHFKKLQAGHFIPGRHPAVLFNEDLVHPQCWYCNLQMGGNPREYDKFMREKYGSEKVDEFDLLGRGKKNSIRNGFTTDELELLIQQLKTDLKPFINRFELKI